MAIMNNVSVWWHVVGAAAIVLILIFVPDQHQSFSYVFTERFNNSGYGDGSTSSFGFWFAIVPFGFLLTQYTITGFDASRPPVRGDRVGVQGGGQGHLALDLLLGARRLHPAAVRGVRHPEQRRRASRTTRWPAVASPPIFVAGAGHQLGDARAVHLGLGAVLLRHVVHDVGVADDLRVQPRRCDPGLGDWSKLTAEPGAGQRGDAGRRLAARS